MDHGGWLLPFQRKCIRARFIDVDMQRPTLMCLSISAQGQKTDHHQQKKNASVNLYVNLITIKYFLNGFFRLFFQ